MNDAAYVDWVDELTRWAVGHSDVVGLVAVGSTAGTDHLPDEFSDHDMFVVTRRGAAAALRGDLGWLPHADRIVMIHAETEHGRGVVYDDGHLVEMAVFDDDEIGLVKLNAYRVLVDLADLEARLALIAERTAAGAAADDPDGSYRFHTFVEQLVVGLNRCARGEVLSANHRIRGDATTALIGLLGEFVPSEHRAHRDNLDPHRRFEQAHPDLAARIAAALESPVPVVATRLLTIAEEQLAGRLAAATRAAFDAVRSVVVTTTGGAHPAESSTPNQRRK